MRALLVVAAALVLAAPALAGGFVLDPELDRRLDDELRRFE